MWVGRTRQILRKIFGPVNIDSVWRIQNNMENGNLIVGADIVRFIKLLTLRLLMSYIDMEHLFLMFLDHTQRRTTVGRTPLDE